MASNPNKGKGRGIGFLREHISYDGPDCLIWPLHRNEPHGYGVLGHNGKHYRAHRFMCELVHGPSPTPAHHAAHSCGNGHLGCVHPKHLSWKTQSENELDKRAHGTASGGAGGIGGSRTHLTLEQIAAIRASRGKIRAEVLAAEYGLKTSGIRYWQSTTHDPLPPSSSRAAIKRRELREARASDR